MTTKQKHRPNRAQWFWNQQRRDIISRRALLSPAKVVLIDEATANVDGETDTQLQQVGFSVSLCFVVIVLCCPNDTFLQTCQ